MTLKSIPEDLPYRIIEKELELEHECSISLVNDLVNMYRQLIEAYESAKDPKFSDFQTRLHKILMRPDVQEMLHQESKRAKKQIREGKEIEMKRQNFRSRKTASVGMDSDKLTKHLGRIVENRENLDKGTFNKAVNDIASQNSNLTERLERRRRQSSIQNLRKLKLKCESDLGAGNAPNDREQKLEELIEKNFNEKAEAIMSIKLKYGEIGKRKEFNSKELEKQCNEEVKIQEQAYDEKRRNEIKRFKEKYNLSKND